MKNPALLIALILCFAAATAQAQSAGNPVGQQNSDAESIIAKLEVDNNRARLTADKATLERLYADDFAGVNAVGGTTDKQQIVSYYAETKESAAKIHETDRTTIRVYDKTAIVTARLKYQYGERFTWLRYTRVYVQRANRWLIVAEHFCLLNKDGE